MSRKHTKTEGVEGETQPTQAYADVVREIAEGAKTLSEVGGLGGTDAGSLAYDIYVFHRANGGTAPTPEPAPAEGE